MPKPVSPVINWSNPLTKGLVAVFAITEGGGSLVNLVDRFTKLTLTGSGVWTKGVTGFALNSTLANDSGAKTTTPSTALQPAKEISILWQGSVGSTPSASSAFVAMAYNGGADPFLSYNLGVAGGGSDLIWAWNSDGVFSYQEYTKIKNYDSSQRQYIATLKSGTRQLYEDGKALATTVNSGGSSTFTNINYLAPELDLGFYLPSGRNSKAKTELCFIWNRVLSAQEVQLLYAQPLKIFVLPQFLRPLNVLSAAATAANVSWKNLLGIGF